ncbi:MAG: transporter [Prevotella sp.]|nr:transporter [Prevotella sp.]
MKRIKLAALAIAFMGNTALAGGILTNTNQSVHFLRNPARDAAIGLDGVYSNPAGVAFMSDGLHLGFNWQYAHQTRIVDSQNELFKLGYKNNGNDTKRFKGVANAPFLPSVQAAYNKGNWSYQFNFAVTGGGGKCKFDEGVGSFESVIGAVAQKLIGTSQMLNQQLAPLGASVPNVTGYDVDAFMKGEQYYFGFQLGAARKLTENLSVYGGLRLLVGLGSYEARMNNIRVMNGDQGMTLPDYFKGVNDGLTNAKATLTANGELIQNGIQQYVAGYMAAGMTQEQAMATPEVQNLVQQGQAVAAAGQRLQAVGEQLTESAEKMAPYSNGINLKSDQTGWGIAPVIGVDYKLGNFNFAAKYEFKTRMRMKNNSDLEQSTIEATDKYVDGTEVPEDSPALLTLGAEWSVVPTVRVSAGYHLYFDKDAHWYQHSERELKGNSMEYLAGVEWDITDKLQVSTGGQLTRYQLSDSYMNDMSFVVNSWTFGLGLGYQLNKTVKLNAAYFQTNYSDYNMDTPAKEMTSLGIGIPAGHSKFTRTNRVIGVGCELTF